MVNFGTESEKDELIKEMADTLQNIIDHEFGAGPDNVSENYVQQLIKRGRGLLLQDKTVQHIGNALFGDLNEH